MWPALLPPATWIGAGLVGWAVRPASPAGLLMTGAGLAFFAPSLSLLREPLPFTLSLVSWALPLALAAHLYVVFPDGGPRSRALHRDDAHRGAAPAAWQRGGVADLVVELSPAPSAARLHALLARTLGDPSVELAFWRPRAAGYVDAGGRPVSLPDGDGMRGVTLIDDGGTRLAALLHDRALLDDPRLLDGVSSAARLALVNARLQAELQAQLREVRDSRGRIVEAGDAERRRIERNLHDGAQRRLLVIRLALRVARRTAGDAEPQLAAIDGELGSALEELRELSRGLHPPILTQQGLGAALETLARRAAIPVELGGVVAVRLPPRVETAAYYVASEALANAAKHAHASHVRIEQRRTGAAAVLEIADDGDGGADPSGSGLRGLRDLRMPPDFADDGLRAAEDIRREHPGVAVLVLSQYVDLAYALRLMQDGRAVGYLLKDRILDVAALVDAMERVAAGEAVIEPALVQELVRAPKREDPLRALSPREREVLALMAEGRTDRGIREALWLSQKTARLTCAASSASSICPLLPPTTSGCTQC